MRCALWAALVLTAFFAADALLFRTGWYGELLEPVSSAGQLESHLYWVENARAPRVPQVLVVGDSRIGEGFSARLAAEAAGQSLYFWNFGVPGTTPRVWYYALRDLDPDRRRFAAIVIALDQFSDEDGIENPEERIIDQNYLVMRLGLGDCPDFALSFSSMEYRHRALAGCLFRGSMLRGDVQQFLRGPERRRQHAEDWLGNGLNYVNAYGGKVENVSGVSVDLARRTIHYPEGLSERTRFEIRNSVLPESVPQTGAQTRYRQRWLGGILDLYKDSPAYIIFLQLPHSPLPRPESPTPARFIQSASRTPRVRVFPEDAFADLERPETFADGMHLNRDGRPVFTTRVAERVKTILAESPGGAR